MLLASATGWSAGELEGMPVVKFLAYWEAAIRTRCLVLKGNNE